LIAIIKKRGAADRGEYRQAARTAEIATAMALTLPVMPSVSREDNVEPMWSIK
jgi:hypothetical protein